MATIEDMLRFANTRSNIDQVRSEAKVIYPAFPHDGCAYFLSVLLRDSGFGVGVFGLAQELADNLASAGWQRIALADYQPGDIGVALDLIGGGSSGNQPNGLADHIYLVVDKVNSGYASVIDNQVHSVIHERNVGRGGGYTPTHYFLRSPHSHAAELKVKVNGAVIQDAEAYLDFDHRSHGWIRPIATALGVNLPAFTLSSVTLERNGNSVILSASVKAGKAFVRLADLRLMRGITVDWDEAAQTVVIAD